MIMKNMFIKICSLFAIFSILFSFSFSLADDIENDFNNMDNAIFEALETSANSTSTLNLNTRSCIVLDRLSKKILYGKNQFNKVKMASTTKIMSAIIVLENCDLNKTVEVSKKAAGIRGSRVGLKAGDKITIQDLLYGLMLCSGNDAAVALAETVGGSVPGFSELMNEKAKALGLTNSHFESPHGLDSDGHYTTAYELALITDYALNNKTFCRIVSTKNYTVTINGSPKNLRNTNELLGVLNGVYGVKTGFTNGANRCLVTSCKRDNMDIICVVLGCDTKKFRTSDSIKLIEYTFKNFEYVNIEKLISEKIDNWKNNNRDYFNIIKGTNNDLQIKYADISNLVIPVKKEEIKNLEVNIYAKNTFAAPIYENDIIGRIEVVSNSESIAGCDILASNTIEKKNVFNYLRDLGTSLFSLF